MDKHYRVLIGPLGSRNVIVASILDTFLDLAVKFCFAPLIEIEEKLVEALDYESECRYILILYL